MALTLTARSAAALAMLAGVAMPGCREDPDGLRAVKAASARISNVAGGAEVAVDSGYQDAGFKEAMKSLADAKLDASNPMSSATGVLNAVSQLGAAGTATEESQAGLHTLSLLRSELNNAVTQWRTLSAIADASVYDPAPRQAELDKQLTTAKGEMGRAQENLGKVQADQDKMLADARDKADQATKFEQEAVKLKDQARTMSAAAAQPILAKALDSKAKCDELRLALAKVEADALLLEPKKLELKQRIQELEIGIKLLEDERGRVAKLGESAATSSAEARAKAAEGAKTIEDLAKKVTEQREKVVASLDQVAEGCRKAASSAGSSKSDTKFGGGRIISAMAKHRLGELLLLKAADARRHAATLKSLAEVKPALPSASTFADGAKAAEESATAATNEAKEALEAARTEYKALKVKGDAAEATKTDMVKYLTKIGGLTPDDSETPATETPAAEGDKKDDGKVEAGGEKPAEAVAKTPEAEVREMLTTAKASWSENMGDTLPFMHIEKDGLISRETLEAVAAATKKADDACRAKFGKTNSEYRKEQGEKSEPEPGIIDLDEVSIDDLKIAAQADAAEVTTTDGRSMKLVKVDGKWLISFGEFEKALAEKMGGKAQLVKMMFETMVDVANELAADVESGVIAKIEDFKPAMTKKLQTKMMAKMKPAGDGNGGDKGGSGGGGG